MKKQIDDVGIREILTFLKTEFPKENLLYKNHPINDEFVLAELREFAQDLSAKYEIRKDFEKDVLELFFTTQEIKLIDGKDKEFNLGEFEIVFHVGSIKDARTPAYNFWDISISIYSSFKK